MGLSAGLLESLHNMAAASQSVSDPRETAKRKPLNFLCPHLRNDMTTLLSYSTGHTDQLRNKVGENCPKEWIPRGNHLAAITLHLSLFFFNYSFLLCLKQPGHLSDRVCVLIIISQWCHLHISLPVSQLCIFPINLYEETRSVSGSIFLARQLLVCHFIVEHIMAG